MDTLEFQVENRWSPQLITSVNAFWFQLDNLITSSEDSQLTSANSLIPIPISFSNTETINGVGLETEFHYVYNENLQFKVNYSFHNVTSSNQTGLFPEHMVKSLINWKFYEDWNIGVQLNWIGERKRPKNDSRSNLNGYFMAGATLSTKITKPLEFTLRVNNILGTNAKEPSLNSTLLPGDIPVQDRSILGQIKWTF
jgi:iron complex outermembrane receptor protein